MDNIEELEIRLKKLAKSAVIVFIFTVLANILIYLYRIIVARHFGPEVYGLFTLAVMISTWFITFAKFGLNLGLIRYIPLYKGQKKINRIRYIFRSIRFFNLISSIIFALILFFSAKFISVNIFHNSNLIVFLQIFSITIPLSVIYTNFLSVIRASEKVSWHCFLFNLLPNLIKVGFLIVLILIGLKINAVLFSYVLGFLFALSITYIVCKSILPNIFEKYSLNKKLRRKVFREVLSYSWPLLFFGLIVSIFQWTDSFIIGFFKTVEDVGVYNTAMNTAILLTFTSELFMLLFFPLVTRQYGKKNIKLIRELSKQVVKWIFILNLPFFILMLLFPGTFINILFGKQYIIAGYALRFLAVGTLFSSIFIVPHDLILMSGKSKLVLFDIIIVSILNIILDIILIPKYGINGAAIATMISLIILNLLFLFQAKHILSIVPLRRKMLKIAIISIIPTISIIFIRKYFLPINIFELILLGSFFILFYIALLFLTGCLDRNDFMILRAIRKKLFWKS